MLSESFLLNADHPPFSDQEPDRQYYYMAKCRQYVRQFIENKGCAPTACVTTFGCRSCE